MSSNKYISILSAVQTIARFWSVLSVCLIFLFLSGEGFKLFELPVKDWIAFIFFPVGFTAGLIIAWKSEITGSLLAIVCVFIFTILMGMNWFVHSLLAPAVLFLAHGLLARFYSKC